MFFDAFFFQGWEEQLRDETQLQHDYQELMRHLRLDHKRTIKRVWYLQILLTTESSCENEL